MSKFDVGKTGELEVKGTYWGTPSAMTSEVVGMGIDENEGNMPSVRKGEMVEIQGEKGLIDIRLALRWEGDEAHRIFISTLFNIERQRILVQKILM